MENIVSKVKEQLPKFNNFLLNDFRKRQINNAIDFISESFKEAVKIIKTVKVEYLGYRIFTPEERFNIEINENIVNKSVNIKRNELILAGFDFLCNEKKYTVKLYMPYLFEDFLVINNTKYSPHFSFIEKLFSMVKDGISIKVTQSPLIFNNRNVSSIKSIDGKEYFDVIMTSKIHRKKSKRSKKEIDQTIIHYLLSKYGFYGTINLFGFTQEDMDFVENVDDNEEYEFFQIKAPKKKDKKGGIYIKAKKELLKNNEIFKRILVNINYVLSAFKKYTLENIIGPYSADFFRFLLGKIINGRNVHKVMIIEYMNKHFHSLDYYLDNMIKETFRSEGIILNDIFDLLVYIFKNFDKIQHEFRNNNLYKKKVVVFNIILSKIIIESIYDNFYRFENNNNTKRENDIKRAFKISPKRINAMYNMKNIRLNSAYYNDNILLSILSHVTKNFSSGINHKKSGKGKSNVNLNSSYNYFHYSIPANESLIGFSSSNPTASCIINPFAQIDENGCFIEGDYAKELRKMEKFLHIQYKK